MNCSIHVGDIVEDNILIKPNRLVVEQINGDWAICFNQAYIGTEIVGRYTCHFSSLTVVNSKKLGISHEYESESINKVEQLSLFDL